MRPALFERDYRSPIFGTPEQTLAGLAEIFLQLGRDFGGPLPPGSALRTVMQTGNVLHAAAMEKKAKNAKKAAASQLELS